MPKTLYLYFKGGRGDAHVTDLWDGTVPTEEGTFDNASGEMSTTGREVGDPYRDIHNYSTTVKSMVTGNSNGRVITAVGGDLPLNGTALTASSATPTLPSGMVADGSGLPMGGLTSGISFGVGLVSTIGTGALSLAGIVPQVSDEVAHAKPRQFTKVCTWLVFQEVDSTATYKFRKADVLGWGGNPRSE